VQTANESAVHIQEYVQCWLMNDHIDPLKVSQQITEMLYQDTDDGWPKPLGLGMTLLSHNNQVR